MWEESENRTAASRRVIPGAGGPEHNGTGHGFLLRDCRPDKRAKLKADAGVTSAASDHRLKPKTNTKLP